MKKLLLCSSSGGHYEQLMVLKDNLINDYDIYVITEKTKYNKAKENEFLVKQLNRKKISFPFYFLINHFKIIKIFNKINPDVVISTGALATISVCKIAHQKNKKVIFIESFAKIDTPTMTGKYVSKFADNIVVQWENMLKVYPNASYFDGGIY